MNLLNIFKEAVPWIAAVSTGNIPALGGLVAQKIGQVVGKKVEPTRDAIAEAVANATPEQMIEIRKIEAEVKLRGEELGYKHAEEIERLGLESSKHTTERAAILEGTASDLKSMPVLGPLMLFLRGCQRPVWGFGTLYIDFMVFSGTWKLVAGTQESAFWVVNILVLGFLFGERAVQNVAPFLAEMLKARTGRV